jgi:dynein heavy chain
VLFSSPSPSPPFHLILSRIAKDGEHVEFPRDFVIGGAVENWLNDLTAMMQECLKHHMHTGIESALHWEVEKPRHVWLFDYIAQVILQVTTVYWTEESEAALEALEGGDEDAVRKSVEIQSARIDNLVQLVLGKLSKQDRRKIIALITLDVHARDCNQDLVDEKAEGPNSFAWLKQLRFYWQQENRDVLIRICDYNTLYSYEWVGNTGRLVITPLTDRCYITLTTALRLMLGGAPAGPAGTGKTETTKDLARALALPCYVFNCSDQMNFQGLGDIFKGLSQVRRG